MNLQLIWDNLVAYSMQIGLLVGLAAFVPAALRLRLPAVRLAYWQILLAACLVLPAVRPWKQAVLTLTTLRAHADRRTRSAGSRLSRPCCRLPKCLFMLGAGMLVRIDLAGGRLLASRAACAAIRGLFAPFPPGASRPTFASPMQFPVLSPSASCARRCCFRRIFPNSMRRCRKLFSATKYSCSAPRLALHARGGAGPQRLLVPSCDLVAARRNWSCPRAGSGSCSGRAHPVARRISGCSTRDRRRKTAARPGPRAAFLAQAAFKTASRIHHERGSNVENEIHFLARRGAGSSGRWRAGLLPQPSRWPRRRRQCPMAPELPWIPAAP